MIALPARFFQLAPKPGEIDAMFCGFVPADENHRNVPSVALLQNGVFVDVDFAQSGAELT